VLILYNSSFILSKYVFTLLNEDTENSAWALIVGFATPKYNPNVNQEFFRYSPPIASWFLLVFWCIQYTRNRIIGYDQ
jgi:hypothetical protein